MPHSSLKTSSVMAIITGQNTNSSDNARYILFLIDSKIKDHDGKIFCSLQDARDYAKDTINEKYADKAVIGMFVWNSKAKEMLISMVETIGFKNDKTNIAQMELFKQRNN